MDMALARLCQTGKINVDAALEKAQDKDAFLRSVKK
jgi:hypothetical protein